MEMANIAILNNAFKRPNLPPNLFCIPLHQKLIIVSIFKRNTSNFQFLNHILI